ncbi:MAG: transporter, partial [Gammaproteobacteria bacterium]|nr:transporter [Gammaproteobacteria bacterium]
PMRHPTDLLLLALCFSTLTANAADEHAGHHSSEHNHIGNEPIGVMGAHAHSQGDWMFSYRFMRMDMDGNRDDSDRVSTSKVLKDYMIAPKSMTMDMHMVGAMYGVNDDVTVMLMVPYLDVEMDHVTRMGAKFTTRTHGIGDVKLSSLIRLQEWNGGQLNLNAGISIPTGSIDEKDDTPAGANQHLPYPMQPGSGTYDLMPGLTYLGNNDSLSWGAQGVGTIRLSDNDNDYSLGDRFNLTTWIVKDWTSQFSSSLRVNGEWWSNIDGNDRKLSPMAPNMVPTADPDKRAGRRFDLLVGASFSPASGWFAGQRIAAEFGAPVYQNLDGPQLETDWTVTVGWQLAL